MKSRSVSDLRNSGGLRRALSMRSGIRPSLKFSSTCAELHPFLTFLKQFISVNCRSPAMLLLHIWMLTDYTRSRLRLEHTRVIHEGVSRADGGTRRVCKHGQMINVTASPDYPGNLVIDSLRYSCSTTIYSNVFCCCSFCRSP